MKHTNTLLAVLFSLLLLPFIVGCGGGGGSSATATSATTGTLALKLTDAPGDFQAVYVTIKEVQVHMSTSDEEESENHTTGNDNVADDQESSDSNGWETVVTPNTTYDLLELQNGVEAVLGEENLTVGHYTQMRLILADTPDDSNNTFNESHPFANYVIVDGDYHKLIIPSSMQTGIKLIKGFDIEEDTTTTLILDFDAEKSIHVTGNSQWMMNPTITITEE